MATAEEILAEQDRDASEANPKLTVTVEPVGVKEESDASILGNIAAGAAGKDTARRIIDATIRPIGEWLNQEIEGVDTIGRSLAASQKRLEDLNKRIETGALGQLAEDKGLSDIERRIQEEIAFQQGVAKTFNDPEIQSRVLPYQIAKMGQIALQAGVLGATALAGVPLARAGGLAKGALGKIATTTAAGAAEYSLLTQLPNDLMAAASGEEYRDVNNTEQAISGILAFLPAGGAIKEGAEKVAGSGVSKVLKSSFLGLKGLGLDVVEKMQDLSSAQIFDNFRKEGMFSPSRVKELIEWGRENIPGAKTNRPPIVSNVNPRILAANLPDIIEPDANLLVQATESRLAQLIGDSVTGRVGEIRNGVSQANAAYHSLSPLEKSALGEASVGNVLQRVDDAAMELTSKSIELRPQIPEAVSKVKSAILETVIGNQSAKKLRDLKNTQGSLKLEAIESIVNAAKSGKGGFPTIGKEGIPIADQEFYKQVLSSYKEIQKNADQLTPLQQELAESQIMKEALGAAAQRKGLNLADNISDDELWEKIFSAPTFQSPGVSVEGTKGVTVALAERWKEATSQLKKLEESAFQKTLDFNDLHSIKETLDGSSFNEVGALSSVLAQKTSPILRNFFKQWEVTPTSLIESPSPAMKTFTEKAADYFKKNDEYHNLKLLRPKLETIAAKNAPNTVGGFGPLKGVYETIMRTPNQRMRWHNLATHMEAEGLSGLGVAGGALAGTAIYSSPILGLPTGAIVGGLLGAARTSAVSNLLDHKLNLVAHYSNFAKALKIDPNTPWQIVKAAYRTSLLEKLSNEETATIEQMNAIGQQQGVTPVMPVDYNNPEVLGAAALSPDAPFTASGQSARQIVNQANEASVKAIDQFKQALSQCVTEDERELVYQELQNSINGNQARAGLIRVNDNTFKATDPVIIEKIGTSIRDKFAKGDYLSRQKNLKKAAVELDRLNRKNEVAASFIEQ